MNYSIIQAHKSVCINTTILHEWTDNSAKLHKTVEIKVRNSLMTSEKLSEPILKQTKINNITEIIGLASIGTMWACRYQKVCALAGELKDILIPSSQFKVFCLW